MPDLKIMVLFHYFDLVLVLNSLLLLLLVKNGDLVVQPHDLNLAGGIRVLLIVVQIVVLLNPLV